jgi:hypothetical protein
MPCARCGACCTSFAVCITPSDIRRISSATGLPPADFVDTVQDYPERERTEPALLIDGEISLLVLKRSKANVCCFYSGDGCSIHPARPFLCRTYPFGKGMGEMGSRACPSRWLPEGKEKAQYEKDLLLYERELISFRKFAEGWNSKGGGPLHELLRALPSP